MPTSLGQCEKAPLVSMCPTLSWAQPAEVAQSGAWQVAVLRGVFQDGPGPAICKAAFPAPSPQPQDGMEVAWYKRWILGFEGRQV